MMDFKDWSDRVKLETFEFDLNDGSCGNIRIGSHIDCLKPWGRPIYSAIGRSLDYRESGIMVQLDTPEDPYIAGFRCYLRPQVFRPKPDFDVCPLRLKIPGRSNLITIKPGWGLATLEGVLGVYPVIGANPAHGMQLGFKFPGAWLNFDFGDERDYSYLTITRNIDFYVPSNISPPLKP
jgi:hypothetical protein